MSQMEKKKRKKKRNAQQIYEVVEFSTNDWKIRSQTIKKTQHIWFLWTLSTMFTFTFNSKATSSSRNDILFTCNVAHARVCVCVCPCPCVECVRMRADAHACVWDYASVCVCVMWVCVCARACVSTKVGLKIQIKKIGSQNTSRKISMYEHSYSH